MRKLLLLALGCLLVSVSFFSVNRAAEPALSTCTCSTTIFNTQGNPLPGVRFFLKVHSSVIAGLLIQPQSFNVVTDSSGVARVKIIQGAKVTISGEHPGFAIPVTVAWPTSTTCDLASLAIPTGTPAVFGPSSSTSNALARWGSTDGSTLKNSTVFLSDAGVLTGITGLTAALTDKGGQVFNVKAYGAVADYNPTTNTGTNNDTAFALAEAAAEAVNGTVEIPNGNFKITAPWVISNAVTVRGEGSKALYGSIDDDAQTTATYFPIRAPYLTGSIITQVTAATDAIRITAQGRAVHLHDFGVKFANNIAFKNTGHAIYTIPPNMSDGKPDWGIISSRWDNLAVWGHDGNHYAFKLTNPSLLTATHLHWWGGGGIELFGDTNIIACCNSTFIEPYGAVIVGSTAHGYYLHKSGATPGTNLNTFIRPQAQVTTIPTIVSSTFSVLTAVDPTVQKMFKDDGNSAYTTIIGPDFESNTTPMAGISVNDHQNGFFMSPGFINSSAAAGQPTNYSQGEIITNVAYTTLDGLRLRTPAGVVELSLLHVGGNGYLDSVGNLNFRKSDGTPRALLNDTGLLIGTAGTPAERLDVRGNGQFRSGNVAVASQLNFGRTSEDFTFGVAGGISDFVTGSAAGDIVFRAATNMFLSANGHPWKFDGTNLTPPSDNFGSIGTNGLRVALVRGVTITSGDLVLSDKQTGKELYKIREDENNIFFDDFRTGRQLMRLDREGNLHLRGRLIQGPK